MKRTLLILVALVATFGMNANAQIWVGGQVTYNHYKNQISDNSKTFNNSLAILPEIGYNLNDNLAVAMTIGYQWENVGSTVFNTTTKTDVSDFIIAPYVRYSFLKTGMVSFFVDGQIGLDIRNSGNNSQVGFGLGVYPGIALDLGGNVSLVGRVGMVGFDMIGDESTFNFGVDGNNVSLGVYYAF